MVALPEPRGFRAAGVAAGMKPAGALDVAVIVSDLAAVAAGVTTRNKFFSPAVELCRERLEEGRIRAIVANSKFSNAATGKRGRREADAMARTAADALGVKPNETAVASTGVIGQFLPMEKIRPGIEAACARLRPDGWSDAAQAIMTTDTRPKEAGATTKAGGAEARIRGIAKGVGMIHPNMGTMLAFIATDATIGLPQLRKLTRRIADETFNAVTVDGDTSTSDTLIIIANGANGGSRIRANSPDESRFAGALSEVMQDLAVHLARDGEGASKLIEVTVDAARNEVEAREAARKVAASNLVKTAIHGCDANWGRIAMALGNAPAEFEQEKVSVKILGVPVMRRGLPVEYDEPALQSRMKNEDVISIDIRLGAGKARGVAWGSDLSYDYIRINADYRT